MTPENFETYRVLQVEYSPDRSARVAIGPFADIGQMFDRGFIEGYLVQIHATQLVVDRTMWEILIPLSNVNAVLVPTNAVELETIWPANDSG